MNTLLVVGGCRSGKSAVATRWALAQQGPRAYIATARQPRLIDPLKDEWDDPEMHARILRHQRERGPEWLTLLACEDPSGPCLSAEKAIEEAAATCHVALFDSVGMWLSALLDRDDQAVLARVRELAAYIKEPPLPLVLVSDEVGMGLVPETPLGRRFRDLQGEANQILAAACDNVAFCACGLPLMLKGSLD